MADDRDDTSVESAGFDQITPLAERLNSASDDLNSALKQIEQRLNAIGIGVGKFVPIPDSQQALAVSNTQHHIEYQVGYDRFGDGWALLTRRVRVQKDGTSGERAEFDELKPLLKSSRALRMKAVPAIPRLLHALSSEAEGVLKIIEDAKRLAGDRVLNVSCDVIRQHARHARIDPLVGSASMFSNNEILEGEAEFLLPADGAPLVAFSGNHKLTNNAAADLKIVGISEFGPFRIHVPFCYTRKPLRRESTEWSLVSPMNSVVRIEYDPPRPVSRVRVLLNNFDYECGDGVVSDRAFTRIGTPMVVKLGDRDAEFRRRQDYDDVYPLVRAGLLRSASLTECSFDALANTDEDLLSLANDIAGICTFAHGSSVHVAALTLLDIDSRPVRQLVTQPVKSRFQDHPIVADFDLPRFFAESFQTHVAMRQSQWAWRKLPTYCGSLEDMPYLEQKFAALMMAIEFLIRTSLLEAGIKEEVVTDLDLNGLIGEARKSLGWQIPKHYTSRDTARLLRNAVIHGEDVPVRDSGAVRLLFDKWRLFLFRRILMRLAYRGNVISPHKGWSGSSAVNDFSEAHNSFDTSDADSHPWAQMIKSLREHSHQRDAKNATRTE